jgi:hypothetical protein
MQRQYLSLVQQQDRGSRLMQLVFVEQNEQQADAVGS